LLSHASVKEKGKEKNEGNYQEGRPVETVEDGKGAETVTPEENKQQEDLAPKVADAPSSEDSEIERSSEEEEIGEDQEEVWDVTKIMSMKELNCCPIVCSTESCATPAAVTYRSNLAPGEKWYSCLDCQVRDLPTYRGHFDAYICIPHFIAFAG
jgi:hypothetical protein